MVDASSIAASCCSLARVRTWSGRSDRPEAGAVLEIMFLRSDSLPLAQSSSFVYLPFLIVVYLWVVSRVSMSKNS